MYLTDEEIRRAYIVKLPQKTQDGFDVYVSGIAPNLTLAHMQACFTGESINPRFARLFQAAPVMYQVVHTQLQTMLEFEKRLRSMGANDIAADIGNMCEAYRMCLEMATHGPEAAQQRVLNLHKLQEMKPDGKAN